MAGIRTCGAGGTFGPCEGQVLPAAEICDGLDNDCDSQTDEGLECPQPVPATSGPGVAVLLGLIGLTVAAAIRHMRRVADR
jgi:hypothetical protein